MTSKGPTENLKKMSWDNPIFPIDTKNSIGFFGQFFLSQPGLLGDSVKQATTFCNSCLEASIYFAIVLVKLLLHAVNYRIHTLHALFTSQLRQTYLVQCLRSNFLVIHFLTNWGKVHSIQRFGIFCLFQNVHLH